MKKLSGRAGARGAVEAPKNAKGLVIRRGIIADAQRVAELSGQLGYPAAKKEIVQRIKRLTPASHHAVFVAVMGGRVIGWVHVTVSRLIEVEQRAEVNGLVVDEMARSGGAGRLLLEEAEKWAKRAGCKSMSVRSNVKRGRAHQFYETNGYEHYKTQKAFRKKL
ncbi:MAG: GNAT family N-acetyltransferase [Candidatus Acidiferrum sp.]